MMNVTNFGELGGFAAVCWALGGFGDAPPDWIVDTFSSDQVDFVGLSHAMGVEKFSFEADGSGVRTVIDSCGEELSEERFTWEVREGNVSIPSPGDQFGFITNADEWRVVRVDGCTVGGLAEIQIQELSGGELLSDRKLFRGDICLTPYEDTSCPEGYECDDCETVWCGEPAPPCEE